MKFGEKYAVSLSKSEGGRNSAQKRPPELISGAKFTARGAESEFDGFGP